MLAAPSVAEAHRDPGPQVGGDRRHAARRLHVAFGVVGDTNTARLQDLNVCIGDPHTVRCQHAGAEKAKTFEVRDW